MTDDLDRLRDRTGTKLALLGVLVLVGALYAAGYVFLGHRIPAGVEVADVGIGGLDPVKARERLDRELRPRADEPMTVTAAEQEFTLVPTEAGLAVDVPATVAEAGGGRSWNPLDMLDVLWGAEDVDPVLRVDDQALRAALDEIAAEVDVPVEEPRITFEGSQPQVRQGSDGLALDTDAAADAVQGAFLVSSDPVELPVETQRRQVAGAELDDAFRRAQVAVDEPVRLRLPGRTVQLPVRTYAPALSMEVSGDEMELALDPEKLAKPLDRFMAQVAGEPRNATVRLRNGRPVLVPAASGVAIDAEALADELLPVLTKQGEARMARVGTSTARPEVTTAEARGWGIREVVSSFVTYYPHAEYRNINQSRAAELISGTVLEPGETFSFNDTVGERTEANGFVKGFVISNGVFAEDLGGGVSQVVTTTFNAAFFAGLQDVEHKPHSFYIDRYPLGREATVAWPSVDLKFKNTTPHGVLIQAWVVPSTPSTSGEMHVRMWSTKYWDIRSSTSAQYNFTDYTTRVVTSPDCVPQEGYQGFDVDVTRSFYRRGELVKDEVMHTSYIPSTQVICR